VKFRKNIKNKKRMKHIKTVKEHLDEYFIKLNEAFDNPLVINWTSEGNFIYGFFNIGEKEYQIEANFIINDFMTFKFKIKKCDDYSTELVNDGSNDYIRVIPTIKEALLYLLDVIKPNGVIFAAMDSSNGRKFVYDRFIVDYIKNNDFYNGFSNFFRGAKIYTIYLKTIDKDIPSETLKFVIENTEDLYH
jgi:hypothetical protein